MKLQGDEKVIHELRPESKVLGIWIFTKCLLTAIVGAFLIFWCFSFIGSMLYVAIKSKPTLPIATGGTVAIIVAPSLFLLLLIYNIYLRRTYVYYVTNQRCVFHGGILRRVERSVPYHKITDVEMSQNIIERILGISSLKIFTPGTSSMMTSPFGGQRAEIAFVGLKNNEIPATTINEIIRKFRATGE